MPNSFAADERVHLNRVSGRKSATLAASVGALLALAIGNVGPAQAQALEQYKIPAQPLAERHPASRWRNGRPFRCLSRATETLHTG